MPLILGTNSIKDTGFNVANSCRFNDGDDPRLKIANPTAGVRTKGTFSTWFKRCTSGTTQYFFSTWNNATDGYSSALIWLNGDKLTFNNYLSSGESLHTSLILPRLFRDPSAWSHIVCAWDTTLGTSTDRVKIYVNGVRESNFTGTVRYPQQNEDLFFQIGGTANPQHIGYQSDGGDNNFDGYLAETVYVEGTALAADQFGEFDDSGIWKPIDVSGLTFGSEGFYLDYADSADLGDDESGNGNDFAETNLAATDQTTDTCTNNFATLNPLRTQAGYTKVMSEGNCVWEHGQAGQNASIPSTIAASSGKWYAEFLCSTSANNWGFGIAQVNVTNGGSMAGYPDSQGGVTYVKNGNLSWYDGGDESSDTGTTFAADDIIAILMDLDNTRVYWYKNDSLVNAGGFDYSVVNSGSTLENNYYFMVGATDDGTNPIIKANFGGSPGFAISSGNTDGNGYGNFEYATKGGYALNTKNLAEFG